ncbi:MAG: HAMP domain-containing sensor histidine kinase [Polyangiales bacterium]
MNAPPAARNATMRPLVVLLCCAVAVTAVPMIAGLVQTRRMARLVVEGEASRWRDAVGLALAGSAPPTARELAAVIADNHGRGLRYLALYSHDGRLLAESGISVTLPSNVCRSPSGEGFVLVRDRVRGCGGPLHLHGAARAGITGPTLEEPPVLGGPSLPGGPILFGGPPRLGEVPARYLPSVLFEFEARAARDLGRAQAGLLTAGVAALAAMLGLGAFAARLLRDREAIAASLARNRHLSALGEMSAVLAHEIRNPLASLKGHAQLLAERLQGDGRLGARADRIVGDATRLERLVDELLHFARTGDLDRRDVRPGHWVRGVVSAIDHPGVHVVVESPPAHVAIDGGRMGEALANVIRNGLEAGGGHGPVTVRVAGDDEGALVVEVHDRGPGITPGEEEAIFEPFHSRKVRGTGLGLAIVRRTVALHGGTVTAENHRAGGALFRITLPAE